MTRVARLRASAVALGVAGLALVTALVVAKGQWGTGFPLDDAWIHMVYGAALRDEGALTYNPGAPSTGCTSVLWALLLGGVHAVVGRGSVEAAVVGAKLLGVVSHVASSLVSAYLAWRCAVPRAMRVGAALAAGSVVATLPILGYAGVSGMEVSLTSTLLLATFAATLDARWWAAGLLAGVAVTARPEAVLAVGVVAALALWETRSAKAPAKVVMAASVPVVALLVRTYRVSGRVLPATFYAKAAYAPRGVGQGIWAGLKTLAASMPTVTLGVLAVGAVASIVGGLWALRATLRRPRRRALRPLIVGASMMLLALATVAAESLTIYAAIPEFFYFQRYFLPWVPLMVVGAVTVGGWVLGRRSRAAARAGAALAVMVVVASLVTLAPMQRAYRDGIATQNAVQVTLARWVDANLPSDAVVWGVDAGALRYLGRRRVVDLMGLNTPELVRGGHIPDAWAADAVVWSPSPVAPGSAPGRIRRVLRLEGPRSALFVDPPVQMVFVCDGASPASMSDVLGLYDRRTGAPARVGRCRRR